MECWKDENGVYGCIQLCLSESHCHDYMLLLHVIEVHVCYWSNKNLTNCTVNKWRHTGPFKTLKTTSLHNHSQPFPLWTFSCCHSTSAAAKQDPLGSAMPGKLPAEDPRSLKRCSQTHLSLLERLSLSALHDKSQEFRLSSPIACYIFLYLICFWNHVIILSIFCPSLDRMTK